MSKPSLRPVLSGYLLRLLASLADEGAASQVELSRRTGIDPSDVVAAVKELEARRFVMRHRDPATPDATS